MSSSCLESMESGKAGNQEFEIVVMQVFRMMTCWLVLLLSGDVAKISYQRS